MLRPELARRLFDQQDLAIDAFFYNKSPFRRFLSIGGKRRRGYKAREVTPSLAKDPAPPPQRQFTWNLSVTSTDRGSCRARASALSFASCGGAKLNRLSGSQISEHSYEPTNWRSFLHLGFGPQHRVSARRPLQCRNRTIRTRGAAIRRQAGRRTIWATVNRRADRSPTNTSLHQTGRKTGTSDFCCDLGARQAARCARQPCRLHTGARSAKDMYNLQ
jgi:hypothetical protein